MNAPHPALALVRDGSGFQWYAVALLLLVIHAYHEQAAAGRWSIVLGGLAFWLMDWINEIANALIAHYFAPLWSVPGPTAWRLLVGLNVEISLMFAVMGLLAVRMLPRQRRMVLPGLDNRWLLAGVNSLLCVLVECGLNRIGALQWAWRGWNARQPWLIFLVGYLPFFLVAYRVHDLRSRHHQLAVVGGLATIVAVALLVFGGVLGWI
jgi:hypothetical protein